MKTYKVSRTRVAADFSKATAKQGNNRKTLLETPGKSMGLRILCLVKLMFMYEG